MGRKVLICSVQSNYNKSPLSTTRTTTKQHFDMKFYGVRWSGDEGRRTPRYAEMKWYEEGSTYVPDDEEFVLMEKDVAWRGNP